MISQLMKLMIGSLAVYVAVHFARMYFFGDIVPVGFEQQSQTAWRLQFAFILLSVEFMAIGVSALSTIFISAIVMFGVNADERIGALCRAKITAGQRRHGAGTPVAPRNTRNAV